MTLTVEKHRNEWLVAKMLSVSVCIGVKDSEVKVVKIVGFKEDDIYTNIVNLRRLFHCTAEILEEVRAAQERTKLPEQDA